MVATLTCERGSENTIIVIVIIIVRLSLFIHY